MRRTIALTIASAFTLAAHAEETKTLERKGSLKRTTSLTSKSSGTQEKTLTRTKSAPQLTVPKKTTTKGVRPTLPPCSFKYKNDIAAKRYTAPAIQKELLADLKLRRGLRPILQSTYTTEWLDYVLDHAKYASQPSVDAWKQLHALYLSSSGERGVNFECSSIRDQSDCCVKSRIAHWDKHIRSGVIAPDDAHVLSDLNYIAGLASDPIAMARLRYSGKTPSPSLLAKLKRYQRLRNVGSSGISSQQKEPTLKRQGAFTKKPVEKKD